MHREIKRVPLDFDAPLDEVWEGYRTPEEFDFPACRACDGRGYSLAGRILYDKWYGKTSFHPSETGSQPLTPDHTEVRAFAERNVTRDPWYYGGTDEGAIVREARRLCDMWNQQWCHHLDQDDVDALVEAGRLWDFTHEWVPDEGWVKKDPAPTVTADQVNRWEISGSGHDSINCGVAVRARCERQGVSATCSECGGHGYTATTEELEAEDAWEPTEPPEGDGWQFWTLTSGGSPLSPVFATPEELADWCAPNATIFAGDRLSREEWLEIILKDQVWEASMAVFEKRDP